MNRRKITLNRQGRGKRGQGSSEAARQNRLALMIAGAGAAALGVLITIVALNQSKPIDQFGCLVGQRVPEAHTIVLIDQTDRLENDDLEYVRILVLQEYLRLDRYSRFTVVGLESVTGDKPDPARKLPNFSRCRVQSGAEADPMTQNPGQVAERFSQLVGKDLSQMFKGLSDVPEGGNSPIIETIDRLTQSSGFASPQIHRRLVLISDMAQHMPGGLSHYPPPNRTFGEVAPGAVTSQQDLAGMQVRVHYVVREKLKAVQTPAHRKFWRDFFEASGSADVQIGWGLPPSGGVDEISPIRDGAKPRPQPNFEPAQEDAQPISEPAPEPERAPPVVVAPPRPATDPHVRVQTIPSPILPRQAGRPFNVAPFASSRAIYVRGTQSRLREKPFATDDVQIFGHAKVGGLLDVIGTTTQSDGLWYQVRLEDSRLAFIRADLTTEPVAPPPHRPDDPSFK